MPTTLRTVVLKYLHAGRPARGTRDEYCTTLKKWKRWGDGVPIEKLGRKEIRDFLEWVYERALEQEGLNPGRTANKAREHLRAVLGWAWEQDLIDSLPRFPKPKQQRDVAGRHYLTKAEEDPWLLKDLRKTCATYYDEHLPESSIEILGHSVGGITYRHYAHRAPLAFKAIMTLPQPTAFSALIKGYDDECPCCRRRFADAS